MVTEFSETGGVFQAEFMSNEDSVQFVIPTLDRAEFLSRLFSRKRPQGLDANSSVEALFDAYRSLEPDPALYEQNLRAVLDQLLTKHKFALSDADKGSVANLMSAFRIAGPHALKGTGDKNLT